MFKNIPFSSTLNKLPSYHTMRFSALDKRIDFSSHSIIPCRCKYFIDDDLIYIFYGRPAFRWKIPNTSDPTNITSESCQPVRIDYYPIVFVFSTDVNLNPKRIFPFDSGAFFKKVYPEKLLCDTISDYELELSENAIPSFVQKVWESNSNYYYGTKPIISAEKGDTAFETKYLQFVYSGEYGLADSRAYTIEYQIDKPLRVDDGLLDLFVIDSLPVEERIKLYKLTHHPLDKKTNIKMTNIKMQGSINQIFDGILAEGFKYVRD